MVQAVWNNQIIAESENIIEVEGNQYFPPDSIKKEFFKDSRTTSHCGWKGTANYLSLEVDGQTNEDAAWYYPEPLEAANNIKNYVAFWKGVEVK